MKLNWSFISGLVGLALTISIGNARAIADTPPPLEAKQKQARSAMREIGRALDLFYADCGFYPNTLASLERDPGTCGENWGLDPYLPHVPTDPWDRPFVYFSTGSDYGLRTLGADGREGGTGEDMDIVASKSIQNM